MRLPHLDVRFKSMDARWRFYGPELFISDVAVLAPKGGPLLARAHARQHRLRPLACDVACRDAPGADHAVAARDRRGAHPDGRIELEGQAALEDREHRFKIDDLPTGLVGIEDAKVTFTDQQGKLGDLILTGWKSG